jgi:hypothetical protein
MLSLLHQCLGQLGAAPADARVTIPGDEEIPNDPSTKYFA